MKQNSTYIFETQALRYLGGRSKANRTDLRQVPHEIINRGRATTARRYQLEDVLSLLRARLKKWQQELLTLKKLDNSR